MFTPLCKPCNRHFRSQRAPIKYLTAIDCAPLPRSYLITHNPREQPRDCPVSRRTCACVDTLRTLSHLCLRPDATMPGVVSSVHSQNALHRRVLMLEVTLVASIAWARSRRSGCNLIFFPDVYSALHLQVSSRAFFVLPAGAMAASGT
jgi:hypothetical protein